MGKLFNICNIYTLLWCVYSLQGALYTRGSRLSQIVLLANLLLSFFFVIQLFTKHIQKAPYIKGVTAFLLLGLVYGLVRLFFSPDIIIYDYVQDRYSYLKVFLVSFMPILTYYYFSTKEYINEKWVRCWFFIFFICALVTFWGEQMTTFGSASLGGYVREQRRSSVGYKFVILLPALAYFYRNSLVKYGLTLAIIILTFLSLKRGAIITAFLAAVYMVWKSSFSSKRKSLLAPIIGAIMAAGVVFLFQYIIQSNAYFQARFTDTLGGDFSGREDLYPLFFDTFLHKSTLFQQLFGHGANGTLALFDIYAHNDWLELAIDTGVFGVFIYLAYWWSLYKSMKQSKHYSPAYLAIALFFIIEFTRGMFSMSYESLSIFSTSILAYSVYLGTNNKSLVQ